MEIKLFKLLPHNDPSKIWAFADFIISFGTHSLKIKGCILVLGKKSMQLRLPVIPKALFKHNPDKEVTTPYSPICWGSKEDFDEFKAKALIAVNLSYPVSRWKEGIWCVNQLPGGFKKRLDQQPKIEKHELNDLLPKRPPMPARKPFERNNSFQKNPRPSSFAPLPNMEKRNGNFK